MINDLLYRLRRHKPIIKIILEQLSFIESYLIVNYYNIDGFDTELNDQFTMLFCGNFDNFYGMMQSTGIMLVQTLRDINQQGHRICISGDFILKCVLEEYWRVDCIDIYVDNDEDREMFLDSFCLIKKKYRIDGCIEYNLGYSRVYFHKSLNKNDIFSSSNCFNFVKNSYDGRKIIINHPQSVQSKTHTLHLLSDLYRDYNRCSRNYIIKYFSNFRRVIISYVLRGFSFKIKMPLPIYLKHKYKITQQRLFVEHFIDLLERMNDEQIVCLKYDKFDRKTMWIIPTWPCV